jgi:hypothetical protein
MAGNTAVIDRQTLRAQWEAYIPLQVIAQFWTVSSHQLVRLREVWNLPPRNDRKRRYKPSRCERMLDPTPEELAASENSLDLAPMVAARVTVVQATWSIDDRHDRQVSKPQPFTLARIELTDEASAILDDINAEGQW